MVVARDRDSRFECARLNRDTFLVIEHDTFDEHPFIYVKLYNNPPLAVLSDTGCGGSYADVTRASHNTLRNFLETYLVSSNDSKPLNPRTSAGKPEKQYFVICTHCHYDHILGLPHLVDSSPVILASSHHKSFVTEDLPEHSLCKFMHVDTPQYAVSHWASHQENLYFNGHNLKIQILHTPGHTPDQLAWYDEEQRHLYVGDSFYERVAKDNSYEQAIIFPKEGNLIHFLASLDMLIHFADDKNAEEGMMPIKIGCGHVTSSAAGKDMLLAIKSFFSELLKGEIEVVSHMDKRGEHYRVWKAPGNPRFSVEAPLRLVEDARRERHKER